MLSHYEVLGVSPVASVEELRHQYQVLALQLHPDKPTGSHSLFMRLQEAWTVLADPHQRAEYDMQLKRDELYQQYPISEELFLEDLQYTSSNLPTRGTYSHPCRCGGHFTLEAEDALNTQDNEVAVLCDNCSLAVIVILPQNKSFIASIVKASTTEADDSVATGEDSCLINSSNVQVKVDHVEDLLIGTTAKQSKSDSIKRTVLLNKCESLSDTQTNTSETQFNKPVFICSDFDNALASDVGSSTSSSSESQSPVCESDTKATLEQTAESTTFASDSHARNKSDKHQDTIDSVADT